MDTTANREFASAASPVNWYEVAKLMHENAHVLHDAPQGLVSYTEGGEWVTRRRSNRPVFLLAAFAMENLVKAYLIYENPHYIEGGKLSKKLLNGHSLSRLQQECRKIPQPKRTLSVLETLEVGVNCWARYPCSTSLERQTWERAVTPEFWSEYNRVFDLYSTRLEELLSKKWKGAYGEIGYAEFTKNL
jgi:hypothetical protein